MKYSVVSGLVVITSLLGSHLAQGQEKPVPLVFHVSPTGNDQGHGGAGQPFATLERARAAVRALKQRQGGTLQQPVVVQIKDGTYNLKGPLVLTPEDSGTATAPVTYAAAAGEKPIICGGRAITGWKEKPTNGKPLWAVELPEVKQGKWNFHQLWVNNQRRRRAKHPNDGFLQIASLPDKDGKEGTGRFRFKPGDLKPMTNLDDVDVIALHLWVDVRLAPVSIDEKEHLITFLAKCRRPLREGGKPARYYVENALELLDVPGEWYLDRQTGTLYYWPLPGEDMAKAVVVAPVLSHLLKLEGQPEKKQFVEHVTMRGLTFAHTEWWPPRQDTQDLQASFDVPSVIQADGARHCNIEKCAITRGSGYGLQFTRACQHNRIGQCEITDLGAGGVKIGEPDQRGEVHLQTHDNQVTDCHLHHLGRIFHQAVGVWIGQSYGNKILHNHIHDLYYTGVSIGWTWGYGQTLARDNVLAYNHIHHLGHGWLSDLGGVYTLGTQPGTVIHHNIFHDVAAHAYGGWGLYFDEGSTHIVAENNLVYNTTHGGFHQHYGKENVVRNNILAFARDHQLQLSRVEPHKSVTIEGNIVIWDRGALLAGNFVKADVTMDRNLYWQVGGKTFTFAGLPLEKWQALGRDEKSRIADPRFVDAAKRAFGLQEGSPALLLGFKPLDLSKVGPRPGR